jgi:hypothetical protein
MRSAPAVMKRSPIIFAVIGSRGRPFLSCLAYGNDGMTAVMRFAEALLRASIMINCSMMCSLIGALWLWMTKQSAPRTDSVNLM